VKVYELVWKNLTSKEYQYPELCINTRFSVIKSNQLLWYRLVIPVCSENHTEHINTLWEQNVEFINDKLGGTVHSDHWALKGLAGECRYVNCTHVLASLSNSNIIKHEIYHRTERQTPTAASPCPAVPLARSVIKHYTNKQRSFHTKSGGVRTICDRGAIKFYCSLKAILLTPLTAEMLDSTEWRGQTQRLWWTHATKEKSRATQ
jgi:hypothetical protein